MTKRFLFCSAALSVALPVFAEEKRELDAHEHGHGALNIAIEGDQLAMELEVPGFDIVGFEYEAETEADKAAVTAGLEALGNPAALFVLPKEAGCAVAEVSVELHAEEDHDDHEEHDEHDHEEHAEADEHEEHAEGEEHDHDQEDAAAHSELHAEYLMTCSDMAALTSLELSYFAMFENAEELEVQLVTEKGAALMEATPEEPVLDLGDAM